MSSSLAWWVSWLGDVSAVGFLHGGRFGWLVSWWWILSGSGLVGLAFMQIEYSNKWCLNRWVWRVHPANQFDLSWRKLVPTRFSCWPSKSVGMGALDVVFWVKLCDTHGEWLETCCHWRATPTRVPGTEQMQREGKGQHGSWLKHYFTL